MSGLEASWRRTRAHLIRAMEYVSDDVRARCEEFVDHNELGVAADVMLDAGVGAPPPFWEALGAAFAEMGLAREARMCRLAAYEAARAVLVTTARPPGRTEPTSASRPPATRLELAKQLRALGVPTASPLMIHASLRRLGPVDGGAEALLDALVDAVGPGGTLLMVFGSPEGVAFDAHTSPVDPEMGALAEVFRQRPGVRVSDHAACRFGALGPHSDELLAANPLHDYYGPGSVLERFARHGAVLRLGADIDTVTLTHHAEYLAKVPDKRRVTRRYVRADTGEQLIHSLDDSGGIVDWPLGDYFSHLMLDFLVSGARTGRVGRCRAELLDAPTFVRFATRWMERHLEGDPLRGAAERGTHEA